VPKYGNITLLPVFLLKGRCRAHLRQKGYPGRRFFTGGKVVSPAGKTFFLIHIAYLERKKWQTDQIILPSPGQLLTAAALLPLPQQLPQPQPVRVVQFHITTWALRYFPVTGHSFILYIFQNLPLCRF